MENGSANKGTDADLLIQVLDATATPFLVTNPTSGKILYANMAVQNLFGYTLSELDTITSSDLYFDKTIQSRVQNKIAREKQIKSLEIAGRDSQNNKLILSLSMTFITYRNAPAVITAIEDLTEKRRMQDSLSEKESVFSSLIESMHDGVIMRMADGSISITNKAAERIFGASLEDVRKEKNVPEFEARNEEDEVIPLSNFPSVKAITTGQIQVNEVIKVKKVSGDWIWIMMNAVPLMRKGEDKPYASVASFSDITQQKKVETELRKLVEARDMLFRIIGHDLRSQLSSIMGIVDLIKLEGEKLNSDILARYTKMLHNLSTQNLGLLENLTNWAQAQMGEVKLHPRSFLFYPLANDVVALFKTLLDNKNLVVEMNVPEDMRVLADANMVTSILRNLFSNAIKYSYNGACIRIDAGLNDASFSFTVQDQGVGMDVQQLKKLWAQDTFESSLGTNNEKGSGIGLWIVKDLVEKHAGQIQIDSSPGLGTAFTVTLPLILK